MKNVSDYSCPICGEDMIERQGPKIKFYGCSRFPDCIGKRTLDGEVFGIGGETPLGLEGEGEDWFRSGIRDGMSYDEAREMAFDWQHMEENDRYK